MELEEVGKLVTWAWSWHLSEETKEGWLLYKPVVFEDDPVGTVICEVNYCAGKKQDGTWFDSERSDYTEQPKCEIASRICKDHNDALIARLEQFNKESRERHAKIMDQFAQRKKRSV